MLPGVRELVSHAGESLQQCDGLNLYFLLGGAGNGKSFAARELAKDVGFDISTSASNLARRLYQKVERPVDLVLLNDATIAPQSEYGRAQSYALAKDMGDWWAKSAAKPVVAFCCVNRGIIVDEIRALHSSGEAPSLELSNAILSWLEGEGSERLSGLGVLESEAQIGPNIGQLCLKIDGRTLRLYSLEVDAHSLVANDESSAACLLLEQVLEKCADEANTRDELCPVRANIEQLRSNGAISNWGNLLSAAELAAGRLLTYRDIWGLIALSVIGSKITGASTPNSPLGGLDEKIQLAKASDPAVKLSSLLWLSQFRLGNAIFRAPIPTGKGGEPDYPPSTPYQTGFALIDPVLWGSTHTKSIEEAMTAVAIGGKPSAVLGAELLGTWSVFDDALEGAIIDYTQLEDCPDSYRRELIAWLSGYIGRLVTLTTGDSGNKAAIQELRAVNLSASRDGAPVPLSIAKALKKLIFPGNNSGSGQSIHLPAFAPRSDPLSEKRQEHRPMLVEAVEYSSVAFRIRKVSGRVLVECYLSGSEKVLGQILLDFLMIREILACGEEQGQTDATAFVDPRLERCRSTTINQLPQSERSLNALIDGELRGVQL